MKKGLCFLLLSALSLGVWADTYTQVEYIATTTSMKDGDSNSNVPYLNTGYVHTASTKIEMECIITANEKNWEALFGTRNGDGNTHDGAFVFFWRTNGNNIGCYNRGNGETTGSNTIPTNERIKVFANPASLTIKKVSDNSNVTTISTSNASTGASHKPIYIFDTNTTNQSDLHPDGSRTYMKLYSFKIYEGDNLVCDYVPVKRNSDNKAGLYDLKNDTFISSQTSKDFATADFPKSKETWNGTLDAILPAIKYGGAYSAYTWAKDSGADYGGGDAGSANFNVIKGTPGDDNNSKKWYDVDYSMPTSDNIDWQFGNSVLPSNWLSHYGDVYVRRYFVVNNDLPSTVYMPAPHDDAPCEYYINGTLVWSRTGREPSVNGWYEDEVVRLTNEQKALIHTNGIVNVFAFHVHQNWGGKYADGGLYGDANTDGTPSKKFRDDTNRSRLETVFNTFSVSDFTTWYGISSETANKAKAACNYRQDASYYFDQLFPAALTYRIGKATELKDLGKMSADGVITLNTAISTATTAKDAGNKDNYVSALTALNTAFDAAVIDLKQNMAEKSTRPTIFTMVSKSVVGTDDNVRGTVVDNHDDGFYVYNVGTGRWFCGGDDWGAHAAVGFPGIKVTTPANNHGSGQYNSVVTWLFNGDWGTKGQLNHGGYCDTDGNGWKFWQQDASKGIFTWARNGDNTGNNTGLGCGTQGLVGFAPSTYARVNTDRTDATDPYNQWIFVTEAQRDAMANAAKATASEANPVDLTYKIKMPGFNQRERKEGTNQSSEELDWTCNHANYLYSDGRKIIMGRNDNHADFVCDIYGYSWNDAFSWTQTVTGLTPGKYRVKVQSYNNGGSDANKAYLEANGQKAKLVDIASESVLPWTTRLPGATFEAPEYFQAGCYWNEVLCTVGSNGELTLGVKSPSVTGSHVVIFDNFRLEYVGLVGATISDANYTTFVAPYNIPEIPKGVEAYACQVGTNYVHLEPVSAIPEGEAVVLKNTGTYTFTPTTSSIELDKTNDLQASDGTVTGTAGNIYALAKKNGEVGFYLVKSDVTVPAGKGYLIIDGGLEVKAFYGFDEDDATSINEELRVKNEESSIYNVAGQRLSKQQRGINIINGKKVLK